MHLFTTYQNRAIRYTFFMCCLLLMVSSCKTRKYLKEDESFLKENKIVFQNKDDVDDRRTLKYELSTLAFQRPNSKFFWVPRRYFYYKVENPSERKIKKRARKNAKRLTKGKAKNDRRLKRWDKKDEKRLKRWADKKETSEKKLTKRKERDERRNEKRGEKLAKAVEPKGRKFDNWVKNSLGEEPAIYDQNQADATAKKMEDYLYDRGYFDAAVEFEPPTPKRQKTTVTYEVTTNERYYFDTVFYSSKDIAIHNILQDIKTESLIKPNSPVDKTLYDGEINRITTYLRDHGYAYFFPSYFPKLDGKKNGHKVNAEFKVLLTKDSADHKTFTIGDIYVDVLFNPSDSSRTQSDTIVDGIHFLSSNGQFYIQPKAITPKIFFRTGDIYESSNIKKTRKQLGGLDIFQFVDIKRIPDPEKNNVLNYVIRLIPKKRMEIGTEFELNRSNIVTSSRSFVGIASSINYTNRNLFKGGEVFSARAEGGLEVNPETTFFSPWKISSWNLNLGGDLYFPKLMDHPLGTTKLIRKLSPKGYKLLRETADTKASLDYNVISARFPNPYRINIFASSWGYEWRNQKNGRFSFNQIGINFLDPTFSEDFQKTVLDLNPFLERSLREQLFTGFIARDFTAVLQSNTDRKGQSWFFRGNIEQSGGEVAAVNSIYNTLSSNINPVTFRFLGGKYEFSQYVRLELDGRYYWSRSSKLAFAFRTHLGLASPFGFSNDVPYTKQFSVGGPTSMRGWIIRELGPGSYVEPPSQNPDPPTTQSLAYYQTGDFKLEMNGEVRFDIVGFLKGAVFLDVGNIWALRQDTRDGADFNLNELAVNSGFGLRLDASIFLLRFDFGLKLRTPKPNAAGRNWIIRSPEEIILGNDDWTTNQLWNANIAIGYPF